MLKRLIYSRYNPLPGLLPLKSWIGLTGQRCILLVYHSLGDDVPAHLKHLYSPKSLHAFETDIDMLLRCYEPIDLHQLKERVFTGEKKGKNAVFISFDDGLSEFYTHAAPLFTRKGIPATCFLNSDFIDNRALFYRYQVSLIIEEIQKHKHLPEFWRQFHELKEAHGIPPGYYRQVLLSLDQRSLPFIREAASLLKLDIAAYLKTRKPYMTSDQIRELIGKGFTFGGHSIDHPDFRLLDESERLAQALQSTRDVDERFCLGYRVFAFPFTDFGTSRSFFSSLYADKQIDLSFGCAGIKKDSETRNLQRIPMEEFGLSAIRRLKADYFYYLLKAFLGKNTLNR